MRQARTFILAALIGAGATAALASPALAQHDRYVRLGHVTIHHHGDRETQWTRFGGPIEALRFEADNNDIRCRSIRVQYGNGKWDRVYRGRLETRRPVTVGLRGHDRRIRRVQFNCSTRDYRPARIYIAARIGHYESQWRRDPAWARFLGADLQRRPAYERHRGWTRIGREHFEGWRDHERAYTRGWRGRHVRRIALLPRGDDVRCRRVTVTFENGRHRNLAINRHERLERGRLHSLDLPGRVRNIRRIDLVCHGVHGRPVTIDILAR